MAKVRILAKTIEALHYLRQADSLLPKDSRTLLMLIDGRRNTGELRLLAIANGVTSFEETLEQIERDGLAHALPDTEEEGIALDGSLAHIPATNLITLDFAVPAGAFDDMSKISSARKRATAQSGSPAVPAAAQAPANAKPITAQESRARWEQAIKQELIERLRPQIEQELRAKLMPELRARIESEVRSKLAEVLRPQIERQLRTQLVAEIKLRIKHEVRERRNAELSAPQAIESPPAPESAPDSNANR